MISDEKFRERGKKFCLLKNTEGKYFTFEEYSNHIKSNQTDKNNKVVHLYTISKDEHHAAIESAREKGYDVLLLDTPIDNHFVNMLESEFENTSFVRVDAAVTDKLIARDDEMPSKLSQEEKDKLQPEIEKHLDKQQFRVVFENMSETEPPIVITQPEFMRRMKDMSALGGMNFMGSLPDSYEMAVNSNHPLVGRLVSEADQQVQELLVKQLIDLALLSKNMLKGEKLTRFIQRSIELI